jgi:hypothetical protein
MTNALAFLFFYCSPVVSAATLENDYNFFKSLSWNQRLLHVASEPPAGEGGL